MSTGGVGRAAVVDRREPRILAAPGSRPRRPPGRCLLSPARELGDGLARESLLRAPPRSRVSAVASRLEREATAAALEPCATGRLEDRPGRQPPDASILGGAVL